MFEDSGRRREEETTEGVREKKGARGENGSRKHWVREHRRRDVSQRGDRVGFPPRGDGKIGSGQRWKRGLRKLKVEGIHFQH